MNDDGSNVKKDEMDSDDKYHDSEGSRDDNNKDQIDDDKVKSLDEKMDKKIKHDLKRRKTQDMQEKKWQKVYNKTVKVKVGDVVVFSVDVRDRCTSVPRGVVGIEAKTKYGGTCAIYTKHGILGGKNGYIIYGPDSVLICKK